MTPEQYGKCFHQHDIADIESLVFDKDSGTFSVPLYMSPEEYGKYAQDQTLPIR